MRKFLPPIIIVLVYLIIGSLYALRTPAWQTPDEPAHFNYVRQLAHGRLPIMEMGDYNEAYRNEIISAGFAPQYDVSIITYEDWQPPLYYLLQTPVYKLTSGSLTAMRLFSVLMGAGVVLFAYGIARLLFPQQEWVAWTTAVFVAFVPQHLAIMGSVNNDSGAELLIAAILYLLIKWLPQDKNDDPQRYPIAIGLLLGLGFLTKGTVYLMAPVAGVALLWRYWRDWSALIKHGFTLFLPAAILGALWWVRNILTYGGLDIIGKTRHDEVVIGQIRTAEWIDQFGLAETVSRFVQTTFNSFWGQFGWMALPMPLWIYRPLLLLTAVALVGLLLAPFIWTKTSRRALITNGLLIIMVCLLLLTTGLHVGYNLTFVQHQGRYLYPALIPIGLGVAIGLETWVLWFLRPLGNRFQFLLYGVPIGLGLGLVTLNLYILLRFIPLL